MACMRGCGRPIQCRQAEALARELDEAFASFVPPDGEGETHTDGSSDAAGEAAAEEAAAQEAEPADDAAAGPPPPTRRVPPRRRRQRQQGGQAHTEL